MRDRRRASPYLVLGVDFGASPSEANRAFARRLKSLDELPFEQADLNWAQSLFRSPDELRSSVEYFRVPTGSATPPPRPDRGLFIPPPTPVQRTTDPMTDAELEAVQALVAREALIRVLSQLPLDDSPSPYPNADDLEETCPDE